MPGCWLRALQALGQFAQLSWGVGKEADRPVTGLAALTQERLEPAGTTREHGLASVGAGQLVTARGLRT